MEKCPKCGTETTINLLKRYGSCWHCHFNKFSKPQAGEPCTHPGCLSHVSHPCEVCGRIAGRAPTESAWIKEMEGQTEGYLCDAFNDIEYFPGDDAIDLGRGRYTIKDLQDLINHMRKYENPSRSRNL